MQDIIKEYGPALITVVAIVALVPDRKRWKQCCGSGLQ